LKKWSEKLVKAFVFQTGQTCGRYVKRLDEDPELVTSLRWLAGDYKVGLYTLESS
jgi:hypothetical protein